MVNEAPTPSPYDVLIVYNPLTQPFTVEYERRYWTLKPQEKAEHPRYLAEAFAREMATAVINKMGDIVRDRIMTNQPQISTPDLNKELLKREPRTNDTVLREKIIRRVVVGVSKLYPKEKEKPLDPKRETAIPAGLEYYTADQKIIMKITNNEYSRLAGLDIQEETQEGTSKITTNIDGFLNEKEEPKTPATSKLGGESEREIKEKEKKSKEEKELFKEVIS